MKKISIIALFLISCISLNAQTSGANRPFNYNIRGTVPVLRQPTNNTCWATVSTMMLSWRRNQSLTIATAMGLVGEPYLSLFNRNIGLSAQQKPALLRALGLVAEPPLNYEVAGFVNLFNQKAPLWITTDEGNDWADQAIHARIVIGVQGNGSVDGTFLTIIDPATGTSYRESFRSFATKYERVVGQPTPRKQTSKLRVQIVHF